ncbi:hypothetical protein sscle_15g105150 [Sclerotinia sclerotiorum 1980 UF-70]|uniref:Uncharacterized protein n=1 Tax=Sclerotinia sclerotiorum (strain ATCC 18683 / 1980 / Ss-1) TaxID=665079 RepID=A0A1D9QLC5_SCLS1|nr:hypothetical protein sscle_15g105150 [Sclerotinia sclerotiorum 1980 UF-70]
MNPYAYLSAKKKGQITQNLSSPQKAWDHAGASLTELNHGQESSSYPSANARRHQRNSHAQYCRRGNVRDT